jgi:hypothetical protein
MEIKFKSVRSKVDQGSFNQNVPVLNTFSIQSVEHEVDQNVSWLVWLNMSDVEINICRLFNEAILNGVLNENA